MIMKLLPEQAGEQCFKVPNLAVDKVVPECSSIYFMIYIYALRQADLGKEGVTNQAVADALHINVMDVVNAFLFFSSKGLVKIHNFTSISDAEFDVEFCFPEKAYKTKIDYRPSYKPSEISRHLENNPKVKQMYEIVSRMLGKNLSSSDTELLYSLYDFYGLPPEVVLVLTEHCIQHGKKTLKAIEREAQKWHSAGVDSVEKAKLQIKKREEFFSYANSLRQIFGIGQRTLIAREVNYINKWQNEFKMSTEMVKRAYEITVSQTGQLSFAYLNKILEEWSKNGIFKPEEIVRDKKPAEKASKEKKQNRYDFDLFEKQAFERIKNI